MSEAWADKISQVDLLLSPQGRLLLDLLAPEELTPYTTLRLAEKMRQSFPPDLVSAAIAQHALQLSARHKFSRAMQMLFTRRGLEQASSEGTARHRARRFAHLANLADLCCGIGGDLLSLSTVSRHLLAVDLDPVHLRMATYNAAIYEGASEITTANSDVRNIALQGLDGVFIDPARRNSTKRMPAGYSDPPLEWCFSLIERVPAVAIKAAPGLPHHLVPSSWEAEFVADNRDLKEAVLWSPALAETSRRATILPMGHTLLPEPGPAVQVAPPGAYLLDPNPAVTRAGLVEELARKLDAWKIDTQIAFLSMDTYLCTPFARTLQVLESAPWNEKEFARRLRDLDIGAVDIRRRGLAGDVEAIRRRLKLSGSRRATVVMTRVNNRPWGLICLDTVCASL